MACWSDFNNDALEHILRYLSLPDHHRFSVVCRNWRWVVKQKHKLSSPAQQLPWLMMREDASTKNRKFYSLTEKRHYYIHIPELHGQYWIGCSFGWLFIVDKAFVLRLFNPFTRELYSTPPLPNFEEPMRHARFVKAILSHDPSKTRAFTVLLVYDRFATKGAFWREGDSTWTCIPCRDYISDAIFFRGKFYLAFHDGLFVISDLVPNPSLMPVMPIRISGVKYLVDFMGHLLIAKRVLNHIGNPPYLRSVTARFEVHFLNLEEIRSYRFMNFGDCAIFLGVGCPLVVDSRLFPGCKRNSIYFTDFDYKMFSEVFGCGDMGIYDFAKDTMEPYYPLTVFQPFYERPIWLIPNSNKI